MFVGSNFDVINVCVSVVHTTRSNLDLIGIYKCVSVAHAHYSMVPVRNPRATPQGDGLFAQKHRRGVSAWHACISIPAV